MGYNAWERANKPSRMAALEQTTFLPKIFSYRQSFGLSGARIRPFRMRLKPLDSSM